MAATARAANPELDALLDRAVTNFLRESPEYCTALAVPESRAGGRYIDRLSDASRAGQRRSMRMLEQFVADMRRIDRGSLTGQDVVTYDVVLTAIDNSIANARFDVGGGAGAPYVVTQLTGAYTGLPDFLASQHPVTNRDNAEAYVARLRAYERVLDQETRRIREDAANGVIPPDFAINGAIRQLQGFADIAPNENVLVTALQQKIAGVGDLTDAQKARLVRNAESVVRQRVLPAYRRQIAALNAILPHATHDAGIWRLPQGAEMYASSLRNQTTTNMTPDEIHEMGVGLVRQLNSDMEEILRAEGLTQGSIAARVQEISRRPDQVYPSTDEGRAQLLADLNHQVEVIKARMPEYFGTLARAALEIKRVPEYTEAGAPGGYYQGAALDGSRPGAYYINLRDPANEWPKFTLPTLTYHEGIPGHHWQISIQQEAGELPFIRSALLGFNAYAEGWGLYAEQLADEIGMYQDNRLGRLGYLQSAAFRASRLVVDTGIHAKRWTREQAIASMVEATGDQESNITTEIERYCVWPGQACGYMVGRQAINRMRDSARAALGDRFDFRGFHDAILTNGSTPLSVTESLVNEWVASRRA
ncbi:MAG: DUF885 family protein [Hyphomonadaceae bacterium]